MVGVCETSESDQLVVTLLPQVHLSLVFAQQLLIGAADLADHLTDLSHQRERDRERETEF